MDKDMSDMPENEFRQWVVSEFQGVRGQVAENTTLTQSVADDTAFIRSILGDVAAGARLLCRLAAAWKFLLRQVFIPVVLPLAAMWTLIRLVHHEALPDWVAAGIKLIMAVL